MNYPMATLRQDRRESYRYFMHTEKNIVKKLSQPMFPKVELLKFVEKIYSKAPVIEGIPNLKEIYTNAISEQNVEALRGLACALLAKLDYDRKYQGCGEGVLDYIQRKGYSWEELNSVYEQLRDWIKEKK